LSKLKYFGVGMFEIISLNILQRASPPTSPRWTAKPMILLENWSIMTMTKYDFRRNDSALKKSVLHRESLLCAMNVSQEGPFEPGLDLK
jgi:hypothetical protein